MNGIVLGLGILVSSAAGSPGMESGSLGTAPVEVIVDRSSEASPTLRLPATFSHEAARPAWELATSRATAPPAVNRSSKAARIVGVALGGLGGFFAGGMAGYALAAKRDVDDDGVSGLRGVVIGAPIGAVVGAVIGYQLTK
jgi:hypothetical protein